MITVDNTRAVTVITQEIITENRKKWIAALRSGKYQQTRECLKDATGYCCLGVMCDIIDSNKWVQYPPYLSEGFVYSTYNSSFPPKTITDLFGIDIKEKSSCLDKATEMNDSKKCSFNEIADYFENFWGLKNG